MRGFPPRRIVVAYDLTPAAGSALEAAMALARRWGSSLEIVHVRELLSSAVWTGVESPAPPILPSIDEELEGRTDRRLTDALAGFPAGRASVRKFTGRPLADLPEVAASSDGDWLVMGTHGFAGLERALYGSVAEAVIRRSRVPVLAVHESRRPLRLGRILAPWNGEAYATRALRCAARLAADAGAHLGVLHVAPKGAAALAAEARLRARLGRMIAADPALAALKWSFAIRRGETRAEINLEAGSGRFDLTVLSAHRRPFSSDVVIGSTLERLLRHSDVPILAIPSGPAARG